MDEANFLGIFWWRNEDGGISYRCRGSGRTYRQFYNEWVPTSSYVCTGDDWPWDYFRFENPEDHERLIKDFEQYIIEDRL